MSFTRHADGDLVFAVDVNEVQIAIENLQAHYDVSLSFTTNGDAFFVAPSTTTFSLATEAGTGTLSYAIATAASPNVFTTTTLPLTLAVGAILKITCSGFSGYKAVTLTGTRT